MRVSNHLVPLEQSPLTFCNHLGVQVASQCSDFSILHQNALVTFLDVFVKQFMSYMRFYVQKQIIIF